MSWDDELLESDRNWHWGYDDFNKGVDKKGREAKSKNKLSFFR